MQYFKDKLAAVLNDLDDRAEVQVSPDNAPGDLSTQLGFIWAQEKGMEPGDAAKAVIEELELPGFVERAEPYQGHVNFYLDRSQVVETVLQHVLDKEEAYGSTDEGAGQHVVIDYSSPNIGKEMHIGHLRSTVIGEALKRIHQFLGYTVTGINYTGDWGTQFGKLMAAWKHWGDEDAMEDNPVQHLNELYVTFHDEAEDNPELEEEGRAWFKKLEDGDKGAEELWTWFKEKTLEDFQELYDLLDVDFDVISGESTYQDKMQSVIQEALDNGVAETDPDGSIIIPMPGDMPPFLIKKSDGATLYATRDLAAVKHRKETYGFDKMLYEVGNDQKLHFKQLFEAAEMMGYADKDELVHVNHGMISLPEGSMSSREGRVIHARNLLTEAVTRARETIEEKNPGLDNKDRVAEKVAVAAVKYFDLSHNRVKDVTFDWETALNWTGNSGPYLQYSYARATGILDETTASPVSNTDTVNDAEYALVKKLSRFPEKVAAAADEYKPNHVANYLNDLCETFNTFYEECRVADSEKEGFRTAITHSFVHVLGTGLHLLGIEPLEDM